MLVPHAHPFLATVPLPTPPPPDALALGLTLPAEPYCAAVARAAVVSALHAYRLDALAPAAVQIVGELIASSCLLSPGDDLYLSLRYRDTVLRLTVYDNRRRPTHPRLAEACDAHRDHTLHLLAEVTEFCGGTWGFAPAAIPVPTSAAAPSSGTRVWVHLPHETAAAW